MSAAPVGYEAFKNTRRRLITLLCFVLASCMAMGISVYVDSYSVHEWDKNLDVGEVGLVVYGSGLSSYLDDVRGVRGITKAALLISDWGEIYRDENITAGHESMQAWGEMIAPDEDFLGVFPNYIDLIRGRFPENSSEIAIIEVIHEMFDVDIGDRLNVTDVYRAGEVEVVGIYAYGGSQVDSPYYWSYESVAVVDRSMLHPTYANQRILADFNRNPLTPFNPSGSLQYVNSIDESIRQLDPFYNPPLAGSDLYVNNYISQGITSYLFWVQAARVSEILRSSAIFLLAALVIFLAIRYNTNERRYERNILISRGASRSDLEGAVTREVFLMSGASTFIGIGLGILFSRFAMSATSYFVFDWTRMFTEPFLISFESFVIAGIMGILLPLVTLGGYRSVYSTKRSVDENRGKLAKLARGLGIIQWDVLVIVITGLILMALLSASTIISSIPLLSLILPIVPLMLFLGVSSLTMKVFKAGAVRISSGMKRIVGEIPASVGVRRISKGSSSAGAAAMVLVLAICLSWNSAIIDSSLPITKMNQAQLSIGADFAFELDDYHVANWSEFIANVTSHPNVTESTLTSEIALSLTADYGGFAQFLGVHPANYSRIGYSYDGARFNESQFADTLLELESTVDGAIISSDIAQKYDFKVGDTMQASDMQDYQPITLSFRIIGIMIALPEMPSSGYWYYPYPGIPYFYPSYSTAGQNRILINREYLGANVHLWNETTNFLCVSALQNTNATATAEELLESGGAEAVTNDGWDSVESHVTEFVSGTSYAMNRAIDTMLTILTVGTIIGAFTVYATEGVRERRREIALLRSMGGTQRTISSTQAAEMLVLAIYGLGLLAGFAPLFLSTSVIASAGAAVSGGKIYPISVFMVVPWTTVVLILAFFVVSVLGFILLVAVLSSRVKLAGALNAAWAEAGPFGGDI